jgi:parallel beta-helix repeat protein
VASTFLILMFLASACSFKTVNASSTIYIRADGTIDPAEAPIQKIGNVYTLTGNINSDLDGIVIERNFTVLDGAGFTIQGAGAPSSRGIYLSAVISSTVRNITIKGFESGILLDTYSAYNSISGNKLEDNNYGINCWGFADNNTIIGNNVTSNNLTGIWIVGSSNNSVTQNNIAETGQYGIDLESSPNCSVYHNNFIGNTIQVNIYDSPSVWDNGYPSGGNYWSDYSGSDIYSGPGQNLTGSDKIGDTKYACGEDNYDNYPFMNPIVNIAITELSPSKFSVGEGYKLYVRVTVQNQGWSAQTTNLVVRLNTTILGNVTNLTLPPVSRMTLIFTWQTSPALRGSYVLDSLLNSVPNEPDTTDNNRTYPRTIRVTVVGDVNADGVVDIFDAITLANAFASVPASQNWNGNADINGDNNIDIFDAILLSTNFNKKV